MQHKLQFLELEDKLIDLFHLLREFSHELFEISFDFYLGVLEILEHFRVHPRVRLPLYQFNHTVNDLGHRDIIVCSQPLMHLQHIEIECVPYRLAIVLTIIIE